VVQGRIRTDQLETRSAPLSHGGGTGLEMGTVDAIFSVPESRSEPTVSPLDGRMTQVGSMERRPSLPRSGHNTPR
jgi:hypothetical protein